MFACVRAIAVAKDVGSKLKTSVNGKDTGEVNSEVPLKEGDIVKVGTVASSVR